MKVFKIKTVSENKISMYTGAETREKTQGRSGKIRHRGGTWEKKHRVKKRHWIKWKHEYYQSGRLRGV